ncbi:MAG: DUF3021 domain-containing protein [Oscillospiraceae bacterium]|nr:DUF3021 domain-containing protein [Oscillospiraceae bacterium]
MLKLTLNRAVRGLILGMALCNVIAFLISSAAGDGSILSHEFVRAMGSEPLALLVQTLLTGVYGAVCFAGMSFYDIEHWSMLRSALVHYTICILTYIPLSLFLRWVDSLGFLMILLAMETVAYVIVWFCISLSYRIEVGKLNDSLQAKKTQH